MKKLLFTIGMLVVGSTAFSQASSNASAMGQAKSANSKGESTQTYEFVYSEGKRVEVYNQDLDGGKQMTWDAAVQQCKNLGDGWRMPNMHELFSMVIQLKDKGKGNFYPGVYWTGETYRGSWCWAVDFGSRDNNSYCQFFDKTTKFIVRPVRTMQ